MLRLWEPGNVEYANRAHGWKTNWMSNGGALSGPPGALGYGYNDSRVFVRGTDGKLWQNYVIAGTSYWQRLGPSRDISAYTEPAVVSWASGRLDVFARSDSGTLIHLWYQDGYGWSDWEDLGGYIYGVTGPAATTWGVNRLDVFVLGGDSKLYHKFFDGSGWSPFYYLGGPSGETLTGSPTAVAWSPMRIDVFARTATSKLAQLTYELNALGWQGNSSTSGPNWTLPITSGVSSAPVAASWAPGRMDVLFQTGSGNTIRQWARKDGGWDPNPSTTPPPVAGGLAGWKLGASTFAPGRIDAYAWGTGGDLIRTYFPSE